MRSNKKQNCGCIIIPGKRCAIIYEPDETGALCATQCLPNYGQILFECKGHYDKSVDPIPYYLLAANQKEAKELYEYIFGYKAWSIRVVPPGKEADDILFDPRAMPM